MRAELRPAKGGPPVVINRDITVVGRQDDLCDLVIDKGSISKLHCVIVRTDGLLFIRDLGSTNGTKVNGQRVVRGALLPGDEIAFAGEKFKVFMGPDDEAPANDVHGAQTEVINIPKGKSLREQLADSGPNRFPTQESDDSEDDYPVAADDSF